MHSPDDLASASCSDLDNVAIESDGLAYLGLLELNKGPSAWDWARLVASLPHMLPTLPAFMETVSSPPCLLEGQRDEEA